MWSRTLGARRRPRPPRVATEANKDSYVAIVMVLSDGRPYGTLCCVSYSRNPWLSERDLQLREGVARSLVGQLERQL